MELAIQKYLRSGKTPADITAEYDIRVKRHGIYPNLVLFKYGIDTPLGEQISQECRGIILDEDKNWEIVCHPYNKFFNSYEGLAAEIDWSSARIYEKLDGSLCTLYYYDGKWNVATSGTPDASGQVSDFGFTFKELFWNIWNELGYPLPTLPDHCFMFELISKYNRIICKYDASRIVLHGVRDLMTLQEYKPETFAYLHNWQCVKTFPMQTLKEVSDFVKTLDPIEHEGFVAVDKFFRRIKIKSPQYIALSYIKDGFSNKRLVEIIRNNESTEFLSYFPEFTEEYLEVKEKYEKLVNQITEIYGNVCTLESQKEFALAIKHLPYSGILFQLRKNSGTNVKELLRDSRLEYVCDLLN